MPKRPDISKYRSFDEICERLDDIIADVRDKGTSLERSLDLFDEAIALGSAAVEMVDVTELSPAEEAKLEVVAAGEGEAALAEGGTPDSSLEGGTDASGASADAE